MPSPWAIAGILDAATTPALSLSLPSPSTPSSSPSTPLPLLSLSSVSSPPTHQTSPPRSLLSSSLHPRPKRVFVRRRPWLPSLVVLPPHRLSLFSYHQHRHRLPLFPLLTVGLGSSPSPLRRRPLLPSSPTTTPSPLSPLSSASSPPPLPSSLLSDACLFLSFTVAASFFVCQCRRPPCLFSPPLAFFLFLCTTGDFAVHRCYRRSCCRPPTPLLSLFFSVFCCRRYRRLPPLMPTP